MAHLNWLKSDTLIAIKEPRKPLEAYNSTTGERSFERNELRKLDTIDEMMDDLIEEKNIIIHTMKYED